MEVEDRETTFQSVHTSYYFKTTVQYSSAKVDKEHV